MKQRLLLKTLAAAVATLAIPVAVSAQRGNSTIPAGSVIPISIEGRISSATADRGDRFTARARDSRDLPNELSRAIFQGRVARVERSRDRQPGLLELVIDEARLSSGERISIQGFVIPIDNRYTSRDRTGRLTAKPTKRISNEEFIGYGAAAGLLYGAVNGKIDLEKVLIGAAAGYGASRVVRQGSGNGRDISIDSRTELGIELTRDLRLRTGWGQGGWDDGWGRDDYGAEDLRVTVNGRSVRFDRGVEPYRERGGWMLPAEPVLRAGGMRAVFDRRENEIIAQDGRYSVRMGIGKRGITDSYGDTDNAREAARMLNGVAYVPVEFFEKAFRTRASYDDRRRELVIR